MGQSGGRALGCAECTNGALKSEEDEDFDDGSANAVVLNVYDLNEDWLQANDILLEEVMELGGAFHAGVEVYGREWSFGDEGVSSTCPRTHDVHVFRRSICIGYTNYSPDEIVCLLEDEMSLRWPGKSYDLLDRNCCTFSRALCSRIAGQSIPDWVDRLPRVANVLTRPAMDVVDLATGIADYVVGREETDFSIASSVCGTPGPTPKAGYEYDPSFGILNTRESI